MELAFHDCQVNYLRQCSSGRSCGGVNQEGEHLLQISLHAADLTLKDREYGDDAICLHGFADNNSVHHWGLQGKEPLEATLKVQPSRPAMGCTVRLMHEPKGKGKGLQIAGFTHVPLDSDKLETLLEGGEVPVKGELLQRNYNGFFTWKQEPLYAGNFSATLRLGDASIDDKEGCQAALPPQSSCDAYQQTRAADAVHIKSMQQKLENSFKNTFEMGNNPGAGPRTITPTWYVNTVPECAGLPLAIYEEWQAETPLRKADASPKPGFASNASAVQPLVGGSLGVSQTDQLPDSCLEALFETSCNLHDHSVETGNTLCREAPNVAMSGVVASMSRLFSNNWMYQTDMATNREASERFTNVLGVAKAVADAEGCESFGVADCEDSAHAAVISGRSLARSNSKALQAASDVAKRMEFFTVTCCTKGGNVVDSLENEGVGSEHLSVSERALRDNWANSCQTHTTGYCMDAQALQTLLSNTMDPKDAVGCSFNKEACTTQVVQRLHAMRHNPPNQGGGYDHANWLNTAKNAIPCPYYNEYMTCEAAEFMALVTMSENNFCCRQLISPTAIERYLQGNRHVVQAAAAEAKLPTLDSVLLEGTGYVTTGHEGELKGKSPEGVGNTDAAVYSCTMQSPHASESVFPTDINSSEFYRTANSFCVRGNEYFLYEKQTGIIGVAFEDLLKRPHMLGVMPAHEKFTEDERAAARRQLLAETPMWTMAPAKKGLCPSGAMQQPQSSIGKDWGIVRGNVNRKDIDVKGVTLKEVPLCHGIDLCLYHSTPTM